MGRGREGGRRKEGREGEDPVSDPMYSMDVMYVLKIEILTDTFTTP